MSDSIFSSILSRLGTSALSSSSTARDGLVPAQTTAVPSVGNGGEAQAIRGPPFQTNNATSERVVKKRKLGNTGPSLSQTERERDLDERRSKLLEKAKEKQLKKSSSNSSLVVRPTTSFNTAQTMAPTLGASTSMAKSSAPKASYKAQMEHARKLQIEREKKIPGIITHKARQGEAGKRILPKKQELTKQRDVKPGHESLPGKSSPASKSLGPDRSKANVARRNELNDSQKVSGKRKESSDLLGFKRKRDGQASRSAPFSSGRHDWLAKAKDKPKGIQSLHSIRHTSRYRNWDGYHDEDEDDGFVVDDDEDDEGQYDVAKYTYVESEYGSDSDMEATGADIFDEEEKSRRRAIREDQEQEKLEKKLAATKASMRKKETAKK